MEANGRETKEKNEMQINMKLNVKYFFQQSKITDYAKTKVAYIYVYFLNIMEDNGLEERNYG